MKGQVELTSGSTLGYVQKTSPRALKPLEDLIQDGHVFRWPESGQRILSDGMYGMNEEEW